MRFKVDIGGKSESEEEIHDICRTIENSHSFSLPPAVGVDSFPLDTGADLTGTIDIGLGTNIGIGTGTGLGIRIDRLSDSRERYLETKLRVGRGLVKEITKSF